MATIPEIMAEGFRLHQAGRLPEAAQRYVQVLRADPAHFDACFLFGAACQVLGREQDALSAYDHALRLRPDHAPALSNRGAILAGNGHWDQAVDSYRRALAVDPHQADAWNNLGNAFHVQEQWDEAVACYENALRVRPDFAQAHNNLGSTLNLQKRPDEAVARFREAVRLAPDYAEAHTNLGNTLKEQGDLPAAIACFRRALRARPDFAEAHNNLGNALKEQGALPDAIASYRDALRARPDYADAHMNLGIACLLMGDFRQGWPEYDWRWRTDPFRSEHSNRPRWDGSPLDGRTILLRSEQGLGDTIQFVRFAPMVKARGGNVVLECQPALRALMEGAIGVDRVLSRGEPRPDFEAQIPLLSLPGVLGTDSPEAVPAAVPYLRADAGRVARWRQELSGSDALRVGIVWRGNAQNINDRNRSIPLDQFAVLAGIPGVRVVSLQKGAGAEELRGSEVPDLGSRLDDFTDTAALLKALDLLITCDTAVAHLAGSLTVPTWVALPFDPDWRWLLGREDSPWYPSLRLFRQARPGDWDGVFGRIAAEVRGRHGHSQVMTGRSS